MESWLVSKLAKKRPPIDRRRFSPVFPIPELQQTATTKDKSCTYISNENRRCSLFSRWINPAAISNKKPFGSSPPKTSAAKKPLLLGGAGHKSQDSNFMPRAHPTIGLCTTKWSPCMSRTPTDQETEAACKKCRILFHKSLICRFYESNGQLWKIHHKRKLWQRDYIRKKQKKYVKKKVGFDRRRQTEFREAVGRTNCWVSTSQQPVNLLMQWKHFIKKYLLSLKTNQSYSASSMKWKKLSRENRALRSNSRKNWNKINLN